MAGKNCFNFSQLNAEAANLYLLIDSAQVLDIPISEAPRQISGLVQTIVCAGAEDVRDETLAVQFRTIEVSARNSRTTHIHLAGNSYWGWLQVLVEEIDL